MDGHEFDRQARRLIGPDRIVAGAPLAPYTTFRVGGAADWLAEVRTVAELVTLVGIAREAGVPVTILGGGSNVVVSDKGVPGLVVRPMLTGISLPERDVVRAEAGVAINGLVRWAIGRGLTGLEAWAGTPGTVGGAIYGNAHWQRHNVGDLVRRVLVMSPQGSLDVVNQPDLAFAYDTSRLQSTREVLVWADFAVTPGEPSALRARARQSLAYRKATQPLARPSAGCVFQNPDPTRDRVPPGIAPSAGALVDRAGLKGRRMGGARISETHANFIVNDGGATAADIRGLAEMARAAVRDRFGVELRDEVVWLGAF